MMTTTISGGYHRIPLEPHKPAPRIATTPQRPVITRPRYQYAAPIGPQPDGWRYLVIGGQLIRYRAGQIKTTREVVPEGDYRKSEWYQSGHDDTPPTPDGFEYAICTKAHGTRGRRDYYVRIGA